jgi:hypothetical protein
MFNPDTAPYYDRFIESYKALRGASPVEFGGAHIQSLADIERVVADVARDRGAGLITPATLTSSQRAVPFSAPPASTGCRSSLYPTGYSVAEGSLCLGPEETTEYLPAPQ